MGERNYKIENFYQGGYSSFNPSQGNLYTGHKMSMKDLSMSTDARTANIVKEIGHKISSGIKNVEVSQVFPEVFDSIPKQQFKELNRLIKLTGVEITLHGPLIEASGFTQQGFNESSREAAERHMMSVVDKNQIINPQGNTPITFHSSNGLPGQIASKGREVDEAIAIDQEGGGAIRIPLKERYFPGEEGKKNIEIEINKKNKEVWMHALNQLSHNTEIANSYIEESKYGEALRNQQQKDKKEITPTDIHFKHRFNHGAAMLDDNYRILQEIYEDASRDIKNNGTPEQKKQLSNLYQKIDLKVKEMENLPENDIIKVKITQDIVEEGIEELRNLKIIPKKFIELKEFAQHKSTTTFGNVAFYAWKEFGDNAPIISIENPPVDSGTEFTLGEDIKDLVEESRKKFVERAVKEKVLSESEAKKQAERIIGATWDVGHINTMKKFGYTDEDIIKETEKVAPFVKHVHLADNFGMKDSELPMGMGNVPIKEIMQKLGKEGFEGKKVIEALNWWQHFSPSGSPQNSPLIPTLEAFGSPMYSMDMGPQWSQAAGLQQDYPSGYGEIYPQGNFETFGTGFSQLPLELGGQRPGAKGNRFSGASME